MCPLSFARSKVLPLAPYDPRSDPIGRISAHPRIFRDDVGSPAKQRDRGGPHTFGSTSRIGLARRPVRAMLSAVFFRRTRGICSRGVTVRPQRADISWFIPKNLAYQSSQRNSRCVIPHQLNGISKKDSRPSFFKLQKVMHDTLAA